MVVPYIGVGMCMLSMQFMLTTPFLVAFHTSCYSLVVQLLISQALLPSFGPDRFDRDYERPSAWRLAFPLSSTFPVLTLGHVQFSVLSDAVVGWWPDSVAIQQLLTFCRDEWKTEGE